MNGVYIEPGYAQHPVQYQVKSILDHRRTGGVLTLSLSRVSVEYLALSSSLLVFEEQWLAVTACPQTTLLPISPLTPPCLFLFSSCYYCEVSCRPKSISFQSTQQSLDAEVFFCIQCIFIWQFLLNLT